MYVSTSGHWRQFNPKKIHRLGVREELQNCSIVTQHGCENGTDVEQLHRPTMSCPRETLKPNILRKVCFP